MTNNQIAQKWATDNALTSEGVAQHAAAHLVSGSVYQVVCHNMVVAKIKILSNGEVEVLEKMGRS